jgi:hypothetical protein
MFWSFFFVINARGIKDYTSMIIRGDGNPYGELKKKFNILDWESLDD